MSQELLFLLFLFFEGILIIGLYQFYLVPRVISPMVVEHWLAEIESGRIFLPKVLESYTGELLAQVDALFLATSMLIQKKASRADSKILRRRSR